MSTGTNERDHAGRQGDAERSTDEAKYRALVENLPAVIYQVAPDDDRRTMYMSSHVETALGYSREEWLEQPDIWMELLHPDDREETLAAHDLHNETGRPWSREYRLIASDGRVVWFRDVANLVRDEDGRPLHWLGVQLDITELKQVEKELRQARDGLELRVAARTAELEEANAMMALEIGERRRAEQELKEAEQRYRLLAEQIPAVTYTWETDRPEGMEASYTSPRIEQLLGLHGRRMARLRRLLGVTPAPRRPGRGACGRHAIGGDGRAVRDGVPLPSQGRPDRLGRRPGGSDLAERRWQPRAVPGRADRRHSSKGG